MSARKAFGRKALIGFAALAAVALAGVSAPLQATAAAIDDQFRAAVQRLLLNLKEGPVAEMTTAERKELAACVNEIFAGIPPQKKRYVVEAGSDMTKLKARFDEVGNENRAELKQAVTRNCA